MNEKINVLLIDDERDFLDITAKRLSRRGYNVMTAESCAGGLEAMARTAADVVVLDVMLPDRNGVECLREIKRSFESAAVLLLTGHASIEAGLESIKYGADDYLLKPVSLEELVEKIEIVFRDRAEGKR